MLIRKKALILSTAAMLLLGLAKGYNSFEETTEIQPRVLSSSTSKYDTGYDSDGQDSDDDEETQTPRYSI
jgi:hypothetical protein